MARKPKRQRSRNPVAWALRTPAFRKRVVADKRRRVKHKKENDE